MGFGALGSRVVDRDIEGLGVEGLGFKGSIQSLGVCGLTKGPMNCDEPGDQMTTKIRGFRFRV